MKLSLPLIALFLSTSGLFGVNILYIDPATQNVTQGNTFDIGVRLDDVTDLSGYEFDLRYDSTRVSLSTIIKGTILDPIGTIFIAGTDNGLGTITYTAGSGSGPGGVTTTNGLLATFRFNANATGTADFSVLNMQLLDSQGAQIAPGSPLPGEAVIAANNAIPEPSAIVLSTSAFGLLLYLRRRRAA